MSVPSPSSKPPDREPPLSPATDPDAHERLTRAYGGLLRAFFAWAFAPVAVPDDAAERLGRLADRGTVVYVGRSAALVTFVFFQHLYLRLGAPLARAVTGLTAPVWRTWGRLIAGRRHVRAPLAGDVVGAVRTDQSALIFLRRAGSLAASVWEHDDPFPALVAQQRRQARPILLVPQILVWERRPRHLRRGLLDVLFGEPESPGFLRSLLSLLWNRQRAFVRFGEPIDLKAVIDASPDLDDRRIARKVRGVLYQHLSRQTRVVTGPPLKTPERLVRETLRDRSLRATLAEIGRERGRADRSVEREAESILREIAARYSPRMIDFMDWLLRWVFERIYDGIALDVAGLRKLEHVAARTPLVICPSHKSHIDYLVMSYVFYGHGLNPPHIAAGINLNFWPLGPLFRKSGAFFIRRSFKGNRIYAAVLKAYIRKLLKDGYSQEFFVEGSRSRSGKVLLPKFGMLAMEVDAWVDGVRPDVAFCPTWIGYAKVIEQGSYLHELSGGEKKAEDLGALLRAPTVLTSRYGRVFIRFDDPISLAEVAEARGFDRTNHTEDEKRALVKAMGFRIVEGINRATAVTPTSLLCSALLSHERRGLTAAELQDRMRFLLERAQAEGAQTTFSTDGDALDLLSEGPLNEARTLLEKDRSLEVHATGGEHIFSVPEADRAALDYYKNAILHFFVADALIATALLTSESGDRATVETRTQQLSRQLKHEFIYGAGPFTTLFAQRLEKLVADGLVREVDGRIEVTPEGASRVRLLADLLVNFVEGYAAAYDALLLLLDGPRDFRELLKSTMERARASFLAGRIRRSESVSRVTFENAFALFEQEGILVRTGDKERQRALTPDFASKEVIEEHVARVRSFLLERQP